jgi:negative regulator of sigma-B (phosphoserine phosphatase)
MGLPMSLKFSHATRPKVGEKVNGDAVVARFAGRRGLLAVVDALGHGPVAAKVAARAAQYLESVPLDHELRAILSGLHAELRDTRGAAAMVCSLDLGDARDGGRIDGCGVGNVELRITGSNVPIVLSPGVLGGSVRQFRFFQGTLHQRSRLIMFSDGISARFMIDSLRALSPHEASTRLLSDHGRDHDDATALVADYEG